jgi:hypothetical protein
MPVSRRDDNKINNPTIGTPVGRLQITKQHCAMNPGEPSTVPELFRRVVKISSNHPWPLEAMDVLRNLLKLLLIGTLGANAMLTIETVHD